MYSLALGLHRPRGALRTAIVFTTIACGSPTAAFAQAPFLSFGAQPGEVPVGEKARLSWASLNADTCVASGDWSGAQPASGRVETPPLSAASTYTLACTGPGGSIERRVFVNVVSPTDVSPTSVSSTNVSPTDTVSTPEPAAADAVTAVAASITEAEIIVTPAGTPAQPASSAPAPTNPGTPASTTTVDALSLSAAPSSVAYGGETTLTWSAEQASKCIASGAWAGTKTPSGHEVLRGLNGESRFALTCMGDRGASSKEVVVNVGAAEPVTVDLSTTATEIAPNQATTLVWTTTGAQSCTASGGWLGQRDTRGTEATTALTGSSTFAITCSGPGGTASDSVAITVSANESAAAASYALTQ